MVSNNDPPYIPKKGTMLILPSQDLGLSHSIQLERIEKRLKKVKEEVEILKNQSKIIGKPSKTIINDGLVYLKSMM